MKSFYIGKASDPPKIGPNEVTDRILVSFSRCEIHSTFSSSKTRVSYYHIQPLTSSRSSVDKRTIVENYDLVVGIFSTFTYILLII
jgi:hypothetical protein